MTGSLQAFPTREFEAPIADIQATKLPRAFYSWLAKIQLIEGIFHPAREDQTLGEFSRVGRFLLQPVTSVQHVKQ
jgi:hypothetical protein